MPRFDRLTEIVNEVSVGWPKNYKLTVLNAKTDNSYNFLSSPKIELIQTFAPIFDQLKNNYKVYSCMTRETDIAVVNIPKSRIEGFGNIANAIKFTKKYVIVNGRKTEGIDGYLKKLGPLVKILSVVSKEHGKAFCFDPRKIDIKILKQWEDDAKARKNKDGFFSVEGSFSSRIIDKGSRELVSFFSNKLHGRVADLGAGWGWLSYEALKQDIEKIDLYEAYYPSIQCAQQNIEDERANFFWTDVINLVPRSPYDIVIMNPPFHSGNELDLKLGINFIKKAAEILKRRGQLLMVANRKLPYEHKLSQLFKDIMVNQTSSGFKIITAKKPRNLLYN